MANFWFVTCCVAASWLAVAYAVSVEKPIKLEDIEKDTLKAAQQTKLEKEQQQQQQQQRTAVQYTPQQSLAYQSPSSFYNYFQPQQYLSQVHSQYLPVSGYGSGLSGSNLNIFGLNTPYSHGYQTYFSPQISTFQSVLGHHGTQSFDAQTQPFLLALATPLNEFQQQQYLRENNIPYHPGQHTTHYFFTPPAVHHGLSSQYSTSYPAYGQHYLSPYRQAFATGIRSGKSATQHYTQHASSTAPQPQHYQSQIYATPQQGQNSVYAPQSYASQTVYANSDAPIYVTPKAPAGQKQQYSQQVQVTTLSPLQTKFLNSPQYLAQHYNTIQSSHYEKGPVSQGTRSQDGTSFKNLLGSQGSSSAGNGFRNGFLPNNYQTVSQGASFQSYKNLTPRNY